MTSLPIFSELTFSLLLNMTVVGVICLLILTPFIGFWLSAFFATVRTAIQVLYLTWGVNANWWLQGDSDNFITNALFLEKYWDSGKSIVNVLALSTRLDQPAAYIVHNVLAFKLFGRVFYAPILLNILLTALAGVFLFKLLRPVFVNDTSRKAFILFFLFHPTTISWSSFNNVKEILVLNTCLALMVLGVVFIGILKDLFFQKQNSNWRKAIDFQEISSLKDWFSKNISGSLFVTLFLCVFGVFLGFMILEHSRRYLIYLMPLFFLGWIALESILIWARNQKEKNLLRSVGTVLIFTAGSVLAAVIFLSNIPDFYLNHLNLQSGLAGIGSFVLTPRPWSLDSEYTFLAVSASLHWIFFGVTGIGIVLMLAQSATARWFVVYAMGIIFVYGLTPEVAGPRHRFAIEFVFLIAQFLVFKRLFENKMKRDGHVSTV